MKDHKEKISAFVVSVASVANTPLCPTVERVTTGSAYTDEHRRAPIKTSCTKIGGGWIWAAGSSLCWRLTGMESKNRPSALWTTLNKTCIFYIHVRQHHISHLSPNPKLWKLLLHTSNLASALTTSHRLDRSPNGHGTAQFLNLR